MGEQVAAGNPFEKTQEAVQGKPSGRLPAFLHLASIGVDKSGAVLPLSLCISLFYAIIVPYNPAASNMSSR